MILPEYGKIVIIDDDIDEVKPLIELLYKNGLPFLYYSDVSQLPKKPLEEIRVLFLDLKLIMTTNVRQVISSVGNWIKKLIKTNCGPYIIVTWSKHNDDYLNELIEEFNNGLKKYKPIAIIPLAKNIYLKTDQNGNKVAKKGALKRIEKKLNNELKNFNIIKVFIFWQNIVQKSCDTTLNQFASLSALNELWNNNMNNIFLKMAKAQAGQHLDTSNKKDLIRYAFQTLNSAFLDNLESAAENKRLTNIISIEDNNTIYSELSRNYVYSINKKIVNQNSITYDLFRDNVRLTSGNNLENIINGITNGIYKKKFEKILTRYNLIPSKINKRILTSDKAPNIIYPGNVYQVNNLTDIRKKEILKNYFSENIINSGPIDKISLIEIETSPACDYAQKKWHKSTSSFRNTST
ncbi:MAG: hypothetical protein L0Y79_06515 [Chlorobi bacterium]|nr:hypothetical protein [Chlorobiota bacterium]MCI0716650.1 hypothetical protein [Chlorobiota bacterium]